LPSEAAAAAIAPALQAARSLGEKQVGVRVVAGMPTKKTAETALGNLFVDLVRESETGVDLAFRNAGSIRDELPAGALSFAQLRHVMPFDNQLARVHLTGADLRALLAKNLSNEEHGILSVSGVRVEARCKNGALDVEVRRENGKPIGDKEALVATTNDFLAYGGDGLLSADPAAQKNVEIDLQKTELDALMDGLSRRGQVRPDDRRLFDPHSPRIRMPGGFPVKCAVVAPGPS
jgi:5'-nucleotidase